MSLSKSQLKAIAERERNMSAIHEAAHAGLCSKYGGVGVPSVWKNTAKNVMAGQKAWLGTFKMFAEPGTIQMNDKARIALAVLTPPDNWRVLVGMAGLVAEQIADGVTDAEEIAILIDDVIAMGEASETDVDLMGDDWKVSDVAKVLQTLLEMWPDIEREAAALREHKI